MCLNEGSITIPPYAPPQKMQTHLIPQDTPRSIFVYFRGLFYDVNNDPEGGYYARYVCKQTFLSLLVAICKSHGFCLDVFFLVNRNKAQISWIRS